ncbi:MAG: iron ABC transporter permease, partial [Gammaproteobacteria bacterium]|nr:iron ABC transporter permease [Gammaproteobacteria bacterium]
MTRQYKTLALLSLLVPVSCTLALLNGSSAIGIHELWSFLAGTSSPLTETIFTLRFERALDGFIVGALLSMAGALLQVLLRNPLAEPYILGISGGAGVATLSALLLGLSSVWTPITAFGGALLSTLLVFSISFSNGNWTTERLLLTGVVIAAGWSAVISFLLTISSQQQMQGMLFWLMGDLSQTRHTFTGASILLLTFMFSWIISRPLNLLLRGQQQAAALGENIRRLRIIIFVLAAAMTAIAVSMAGSIGFVGLIIPHALRLIGLRDYRVLLPAAVLTGG